MFSTEAMEHILKPLERGASSLDAAYFAARSCSEAKIGSGGGGGGGARGFEETTWVARQRLMPAAWRGSDPPARWRASGERVAEREQQPEQTPATPRGAAGSWF